MAERTPEQITRELAAERGELVEAVDELRASVEETRAKANEVKRKLPFVIAGVTAAAFVVTSGLGATFRLFSGRGKERSTELWRVGRYSLHEDDE